MSELIKIAITLVVVTVLLIVAAVIIIPFFIDPNDFKPQIAAAVKQHTTREIEIEGDLGLSVFPWLGIETGKISLSNAPGFGDSPFAQIEHAQIKVKLAPLLSKKIEISRIVVKGLTLNLAKNKNGVSNWEDLRSKPKPKPKSEQEVSEKQINPISEDKDSTLAGLAIGGIALNDANIIWDDRSKAQHVEISDFNFLMDQLSFDRPVDFDVGFILNNQEPKLTEKLNLSGNLTVNPTLDIFKLGDMKLISTTEGDSVPGGSMEIMLMLSVDANLKDQTATITGLKFNAMNLAISGDLKGDNILDAPLITGRISIAQFSPRELLKTLALKAPVTRDSNTLQKLQADFQLKATNKILELHNLSIQLDDTTINGKTKIVDFSNPAIAFNFEIDDIDVDRYLPPKKQKTPEKTKTSSTSTSQSTSTSTVPANKAAEFPLETLRALNVQGELKISRLTVKGIKAQGVELNIQGKDGVITSKQSVEKLYQGNYQGSIHMDARTDVPTLALNQSLSNVQVGPLLLDATGKTPISGAAKLSAQLSARGINTDAIKSSLNGTINALFTDGAVQGVNLVKMVRTAKKLLKGQSTQLSNETDKTEFSEFKLASTVNNGIVNTHEFIVKSPLLRVTGSGTANLISKEIDYRIITKLVSSLEGQGGAETKDLKGIPIGINVGGSLSKPSYSLDLATSLTPKQKAKIEKKKQKLLDKLDKKLGPGASDLFKQFF